MEAGLAAPLGFRDAHLCGRGATSRVYRAVEARTGRVVALKRLHRHLVRSQDALARLKRELDALTALRHPGIVNVSDVIKWEGDPTLVMDFVEGEDLKERINRLGRLPFDEVERVARAFLDILAATHAAGIVHRDLKPQNIRIAADGSVHLLDFGSARLDAASVLTATGTTVGTPEYMPPELFAGSVYDPRADIFGVGATLYECLTGRPPQSADTLAELAYTRSRVDVPPIRSVVPDTPVNLAQVIDRCLSRAPEDRYPSAAAAAWALANPDAERAFLARRSAHPPCIQCGAAIAAESSICPHCRRHKPFALQPGDAHVQIHTVENPVRFMEQLATMLPERNVPGQLLQLTEHLAGLSFGELRFASFIHEDDAQMLVRQLGEAGVHASVVRDTRLTPAGSMLNIASWVAGMAGGSIALGAVLALGNWALDRMLALETAQQGVLAVRTSRFKQLVPSSLTNAVRATWALALAGVAGLGTIWEGFTFSGAFALACGAVVAGGLVASRTRIHISRSHQLQTPEPTLWKKVRPAFSLVRRKGGPAAPVPRMQPLVGGFAIIVGILIVPVELSVLDKMVRAHRWPTPTSIEPGPSTDPVPGTTPGDPAGGASGLPSHGTVVAPPRTVTAGMVAGAAAGALPVGIVIALLVRLRRRARRVKEDARVIYSELDLVLMERLSRRARPLDRHAERPAATGRPIAALPASDAFVAEAICRAAEMAPLLPKESVLKLSSTLELMGKRGAASADAERSLLSRCILETDAEQKARFDFLALEGQLYVSAATAWAAKLKERGR